MTPASGWLHGACTWEQHGIAVWCREHNHRLYVGALPPRRQPDPCEPGTCAWEEGPLGLYRRCPQCFQVEWPDAAGKDVRTA